MVIRNNSNPIHDDHGKLLGCHLTLPLTVSRHVDSPDFSKWMLLDFSAVDGRGTKKIEICVELGYSDPRFSGIYPTPSELGDIESQTFSISI